MQNLVEPVSLKKITLGERPLQWIEECSDPWLKSLLLQQVQSEIPWQIFIALGSLVRLRRHTNSKILVEELLQGKLPPTLEREREWAKTLDTTTVEEIAIRAMTHSETLSHHLQSLFQDFEDGNIVTKRGVLHVLYLRDDLESGRLLFEAAGFSSKYCLISRMDQWAKDQLLPHIRSEFKSFEDERLSRASVANPVGWWCSLIFKEVACG